MKFIDLYNKLSTLYPENLRCDWDNDGIMCADDTEKEVKKILITLDVTKSSIEYAVANGFDTIISHHPLVFHAQNMVTPENYVQEKLIMLIKSGIRVASFHTRLDAAKNGVNDALCSKLGFNNTISDSIDPIGRIAVLSDSVSVKEFSEHVKSSLGSPCVLYSGNRAVKKVYVVGGDGKDMIKRAIECGCDTLLTGRASYNTSVDAPDMKLNIVEAGHFYTEDPVCENIAKEIKKLLPKTQTYHYISNTISLI